MNYWLLNEEVHCRPKTRNEQTLLGHKEHNHHNEVRLQTYQLAHLIRKECFMWCNLYDLGHQSEI